MKIYIHGFNSCLQRKFSIQQYVFFLKDQGHVIVHDPAKADKIFLWTCAFRDDFCKSSIEGIKSFREKFGLEKIVVCGCLPAINESLLKENYEGIYFCWKNDKTFFKDYLNISKSYSIKYPIVERNFTLDIDRYREMNPQINASYYDQFIKVYVSEGCLYDCSYCTEKLAFPEHKSYPVNGLISNLSNVLLKSNTKKVALIADSLGNYGFDNQSTLQDLLKKITELSEEITLGLMNLHPSDFLNNMDFLLELIKDEKIFLLNIPIQSASDKILQKMNRNYSKSQIQKIFSSLNDVKFGNLETHVIIGFPSETHEDFLETCNFLLQFSPKYVMASAYMESKGMESKKINPKIEQNVIEERMNILVDALKRKKIICNYNNCESFIDRKKRMHESESWSYE